MFRPQTLFSLATLLLISIPARAEEQPTQKLNDAAQAAFDEGKFKKAELSWTRAVKTMEENGQKDSYLEVCLKKLGQTKKRLQQTVEAYQTLMRAYEMCILLGVQDQELAQELIDLSTSYRAVDLAALGDGTATALKKANVGGVGLVKTATGTMMRVDLPEKFEKHLDDEKVDALEFDKIVTLDLAEEPDGTVFLKNIKGFKIHSKEKNMWVNLIDTVVKPADADGQYPAQVTAGKMGVTKTVDAKLPAKGFEPISGLLKQLHAMVSPLQVAFTNGAGMQAAAAPTIAPAQNAPVQNFLVQDAPAKILPKLADLASAETSGGLSGVVTAPNILAASNSSVASADASSKTSTAPTSSATPVTSSAVNCDQFFADIETTVRKYFPRAKFKKTKDTLHFEFKSRTDMVRPPEKNGEAQKEVPETVADWGGVVGNLTLRPGQYSGADNMPMLLKNRSSYEVYLDAPYSKKFNNYLDVRLSYPFDANQDFLKELKEQASKFETGCR